LGSGDNTRRESDSLTEQDESARVPTSVNAKRCSLVMMNLPVM
jgi:hypothetical protein